ncbi:nicotinamide N-methyltransferase [Anolis carolinensis]|uniref:Phenylethanolamine N-methyltransferase n=1 Tax=Anolis carolinensis TaxID=28377 RepID=A0A803T0B9_ANOCA|nr:PREDICTED: nicotinamide N-methyltransferase [Anolis carolinensis]|eukprot:XP_003228832.1 PREDICTED: nicotinamide N-methyltransferase [Anolis carolinensis]
MEGEFTGKEVYEQTFCPKEYLNMYLSFGSGDGTVFAIVLDKLHKAFAKDGIRGDTLIDIGSGPTIHQLLSACESFKEIIVSDFLEQNREVMKKWLKKDPETFDWAPVLKYVCQLEGDREKWMEKEEKLRKTIKQVLKCDVTWANPFDPIEVHPADCVLSTYCIEAASKDLPTYHSAMKNVGSLVKPGGHLILVVALEETYYMVGPNKFSSLYLAPEMVRDVLKGAGFDVVSSEVFLHDVPLAISDIKASLFIVAQKPNEI